MTVWKKALRGAASLSLLTMPAWGAGSAAHDAAYDYTIRFIPLWFSHEQSAIAPANTLVGPDRVTPLYHTVVAINVDTLYASTFVDLSQGPVVLTIPQGSVGFSALLLDRYGNVLTTGLTASAGTYVLTGSVAGGTPPQGATPVSVPVDHPVLIFRVDTHAPDGTDMSAAANAFRKALLLKPLAAYCAGCGAATVLPEIAFSLPYKQTEDTLAALAPVTLLRMIATAVHSPTTPTLDAADQALSDQVDALLAASTSDGDLAAGVRDAHAAWTADFLGHTGATNWVHFSNVGAWGDAFLDRAAITEFLQYGNTKSTAVYWHAFSDGAGQALDGRHIGGYTITFPAGSLPPTKRFWSLTAYTSDAIELVPNPWGVYHVASYTPGLATNPDGSLTIHLVVAPPAGVNAANVLPIPPTTFSVTLRDYGPTGSAADGSYLPPPVIAR